jgi:hypothetical protein
MKLTEDEQKEFRQYAQHCQTMAQSSLSEADRQHWQKLFDYWNRRDTQRDQRLARK